MGDEFAASVHVCPRCGGSGHSLIYGICRTLNVILEPDGDGYIPTVYRLPDRTKETLIRCSKGSTIEIKWVIDIGEPNQYPTHTIELGYISRLL